MANFRLVRDPVSRQHDRNSEKYLMFSSASTCMYANAYIYTLIHMYPHMHRPYMQIKWNYFVFVVEMLHNARNRRQTFAWSKLVGAIKFQPLAHCPGGSQQGSGGFWLWTFAKGIMVGFCRETSSLPQKPVNTKGKRKPGLAIPFKATHQECHDLSLGLAS